LKVLIDKPAPPATEPPTGETPPPDTNPPVTEPTPGNPQPTNLPVVNPPIENPVPGNPYANLKIGSTVRLGNYNWRVYDVRNGQAFVISTSIVGIRSYHSNRNANVTWANSEIRSWLNGSFYNSFAAEEKKYIAQTSITNANNQWHNTPGGGATTDRIFLLSLEEVVRYFGNSGQINVKQSSPINDAYNASRRTLYNGQERWWWLRSPGNANNRASNINNNGFIDLSGDHVDNNNGGIRPALWLNIN
jgi:hypothetical protein